MPPCRSRANPGGSPISIPGAALTVLATPSESCGFSASDKNAPIPALLLKLLFTSEPLSIQVHPDDEFARSIGLPNGKTEAWYILAANPGARVALGLKRHLTPQELRAAIRDGSIADLTQWRPVAKGDIIFVPAGTIHAIGAGIVLAEIQQRSDTTFRLFDYGRQRELHEESAVAVSDAGPVQTQSGPRRLTSARTVLIASPHFVLERIDLPANSNWALDAEAGNLDPGDRGARADRVDEYVGRRRRLYRGRSCRHRGWPGRDERPDRLSGTGSRCCPVARLWRANDQICRHVRLHRPKSSEIVEVQT